MSGWARKVVVHQRRRFFLAVVLAVAAFGLFQLSTGHFSGPSGQAHHESALSIPPSMPATAAQVSDGAEFDAARTADGHLPEVMACLLAITVLVGVGLLRLPRFRRLPSAGQPPPRLLPPYRGVVQTGPTLSELSLLRI